MILPYGRTDGQIKNKGWNLKKGDKDFIYVLLLAHLNKSQFEKFINLPIKLINVHYLKKTQFTQLILKLKRKFFENKDSFIIVVEILCKKIAIVQQVAITSSNISSNIYGKTELCKSSTNKYNNNSIASSKNIFVVAILGKNIAIMQQVAIKSINF